MILFRAFAWPAVLGGMICALSWLWAAPALRAEVHQVAPPGSTAPDGAWASLAALLAADVVAGGDDIALLAGNHGDIALKGLRFDRPVTIRPAPGARARLTGLVISQSRNLIFEGLQVWPDSMGTGKDGHLIRTTPDTRAIVFRNLDVRGRADAARYRNWSRQTWLAADRAGILLRGPASAVLGSRFTGLSGGLGITGDGARIEGNVIRGFGNDGIQITADNVVVRGNQIEDCVKVDDNHDDGIQAWSLGPEGKPGRGTVKNLKVQNNIILEWRGRQAPALVCDLQGIGLFDGTYTGLEITNNLVMVSAYHGISVYGGIDSVIANNTVLHRTRAGADRPWIGVFTHKDGRPSRRMVVANNLAPKFAIARESGALTTRQNMTERYPARQMVAPYEGDFTPRADSGMMDTGARTHAPARDLFGRLRGAAPDVGAIERP